MILNEAKQSLAKAEEEVREELERERLGTEIELLDSLLDPKVLFQPSPHFENGKADPQTRLSLPSRSRSAIVSSPSSSPSTKPNKPTTPSFSTSLPTLHHPITTPSLSSSPSPKPTVSSFPSTRLALLDFTSVTTFPCLPRSPAFSPLPRNALYAPLHPWKSSHQRPLPVDRSSEGQGRCAQEGQAGRRREEGPVEEEGLGRECSKRRFAVAVSLCSLVSSIHLIPPCCENVRRRVMVVKNRARGSGGSSCLFRLFSFPVFSSFPLLNPLALNHNP